MESKFKESIGIITQNIINELNKLISFNYLEHRDTFYLWFTTNCDYDFAYIYEMAFKRFLLEHFTIETERILSYYSQNAVYAICTYYEMKPMGYDFLCHPK
jgi:hypothetical protein